MLAWLRAAHGAAAPSGEADYAVCNSTTVGTMPARSINAT